MVLLPLDKPFRIGRSSKNDLSYPDPTISREHGSISWMPDVGYCYEDLGSSTGSWLGTQKIEKYILVPGDLIRIGVQRLRFSLQNGMGYLEHLAALDASLFKPWSEQSALKIGRSPNCDIHVAHPLCPQNLISLHRKHGEVLIQSKHKFSIGKHAQLPFQLDLPFGFLDVGEAGVEWIPHPNGFELEAQGLGVLRDNRQILSDIHFHLAPGEILAIVGRSGHGKSTLLRSLSGDFPIDQGALKLFPGSRQQIAWLQQNAPLFPYLTVEESLQDACTLRLPADTSAEECKVRIQSLVKQLGLENLRQRQNRVLSGGEQRRVALACELVSSPGLILLDEPFAGLDPVNVNSMASWFRQLGWAGHTLVLTTHDYAILPHVDKVLVLHQGTQAFFGTPQAALAAFASETPAQMLEKLSELDCETQAKTRALIPPLHLRSFPRIPVLHVPHRSPVPLLLRRVGKSLLRDRGRLIASLLQPLIIASLLAMLFQASSSLWIAAFALNLCINWFGMSSSIREVVADKHISEQEWGRGLSPFTDLATKLFALFSFAFLQTAICALVLKASLHWTGSTLSLLGLAGAALAAPVAAGLVASALARSAGQANAMLPLLLIPQVMFAGALVPLDQMSAPGQWISRALWSSWTQSSLQGLFTRNPMDALDLMIPALIALGIVIICAWVLKAKITRNIHSTSTKNTM